MKNILIRFVCSLMIIGIIVLAFHNYKNNAAFWNTSFSSCASLALATGLSFYLVQRQTDLRKQKEIFIKLLESLKNLLDDEESCHFHGVTEKKVLMRKRDISNKIEFITHFSRKFSIQDEICFLEEKYNEYAEIIGNHIDDLTILEKISDDLSRPLTLMSQKVYEIMINLYN